MNKYQRITVVFLCLLMTTAVCAAQSVTDVIEAINDLDIKALRKVNIVSENQGNLVTLVLDVTNNNSRGLRLVDSQFDVLFNMRKVGAATIAKETFVSKQRRQVTLLMHNVPVSDVLYMINVIGDPTTNRQVTLVGTSEAEIEVNRGWFGEPGRRIKVELNYQPQFQREVLLD